MQKILAMILAGGRVDELSVLTQYRPKSAVPFGGFYRVIDFPMSSLMHSGIENVEILSQYRSYSLNNHIGNGAAWEMVGRKVSPVESKGEDDATYFICFDRNDCQRFCLGASR